jgi:hypothetical protein
MQEWILRLRRRGIAVLLVHHSGKSGEQRGTSRREDVLDTVIGLRRPEDYEPQQGARFEVHVEKSRAHFGDAGRPFEASLVSMPDGRGLTWSARDLKPNNLEEAAALFRSGVTVRAAAAQLGIARSSAGRLRQKAHEDGLLDSDGESEADGGEDESGTLHYSHRAAASRGPECLEPGTPGQSLRRLIRGQPHFSEAGAFRVRALPW